MRVALSLGVDVAVRRGLDLVLVDSSRAIGRQWSRVAVEDLGGVLEQFRPDVVAIDSPPTFGVVGRSRLAERELMRRRVQIHSTPSDATSRLKDFYQWMTVGHRAFEVAREEGYACYRAGDSVEGTAIEVFPNASAVALKSALPPPGWAKSSAGKRDWRSAVLAGAGVETSGLRTIDQVDAALAALTGILALEGEFCAVGDPHEGVLVLPTRTLPTAYASEDEPCPPPP